MEILLAATMAVVAACGGETPDEADSGAPAADAIPPMQRLLPLAVGNSWTFKVTDSAGVEHTKMSTVEALEDVGGAKAGVTAFRVRTENLDGVTVSWQEDTGNSIIRHREQSFDLTNVLLSDQVYVPHKLRVDEIPAHLVQGATWMDTYNEIETNPTTGQMMTTAKIETWSVVAVDESVTVPAGTFMCIHLHRVGSDATTAAKDFWYAPGVGKVKETGGQTEELTATSLQ